MKPAGGCCLSVASCPALQLLFHTAHDSWAWPGAVKPSTCRWVLFKRGEARLWGLPAWLGNYVLEGPLDAFWRIFAFFFGARQEPKYGNLQCFCAFGTEKILLATW